MSTQDQVITGGRELDDLLATLPGKMQKNINRAALSAGARVLLGEVRKRIPVDTGNLRKTARISSEIKGANVSASVKVGGKKTVKRKGKKVVVDAFYAKFVEFGTRPHLITVDDRNRKINKKTGRPISMTTINRQQRALGSLSIGGNLVGPSVMHSGSRARPFMRPAAQAALSEAVNAVKEKIRERLTKQGLNTPTPIPGNTQE